jgi:hypothetical protein
MEIRLPQDRFTFRNDLVFYIWLLVIVLEVADLLYRRFRRSSRNEVQVKVNV